MADVFISYARDDEAVARRVARGLESAGLDVWWDANLPAHRAYSEEIERNLEAARAVVVLWSATAAKSQWVRAEADFARNANKLVQAQVDGALPPMPFNQIQCADLKGWRGSPKHPGWAKLKGSVEAVLSGQEVPAEQLRPPSGWGRFRQYRWWAAAALALVVVAAGLLLFLRGPAEERKPVLAVLPFKSLDARDESLAAGIWEDTRQAIGRNPQLLVLGPNTSEQLAQKGGHAAMRAADYLVEASVRSLGDRVRVSANLVRSNDRAQIWSDTFEQRLDDVFELQSRMAREIEGRIRGRLATGGGVMPENIATSGEVYALYSDARAKLRRRQFGGYLEATSQLERVVRMDPNFAPGWATLAVAKSLGAGAATEGSAEADARRAIALAPNLAAGHAALGLALQSGPAAEASLRRALALDPNDIEAMNWLANSLDDSRYAEKLRLYSRVVEIEPLWWPAILNKLDLLLSRGDSNAAKAEIARVEKLGDLFTATLIRMQLAIRSGDLSTAVSASLAQYRRVGPKERQALGVLLWQPFVQLGYFDLADKVSPPPPQAREFIPYLRSEDARALKIIEARMGPRQFWSIEPLSLTGGRVYLLNGQGAGLARQYRAVASTPDQFERVVGRDRLVDLAPLVALALQDAGDAEQARALLARAESLARSNEASAEGQVQLARIHAVQGRHDEALGLLSSAVRRGWLPTYVPVHMDIALDPPLLELRKDPRFEPLRQQILGHIKKERVELGPVKLN